MTDAHSEGIDSSAAKTNGVPHKDRTMNHTHYQQLTSQFIDRELAHEAEQELFAHLGVCDECRGFLRNALIMQVDILATKRKDWTQREGQVARAAISASVARRTKVGLFERLWHTNVPAPVAFGVVMILLVVGIFIAGPREGAKPIQSQTVPQARAVMSMPTIVVTQK